MAEQLLCAHCHRPFDSIETHVRQARLNLEGTATTGEFDAYHLGCYKTVFELSAPQPERDPDE